MSEKKTLMHVCCAPCSVSCITTLRAEGIEPVGYWYNPNIHPYMEYAARRDCLVDYAKREGLHIPEITVVFYKAPAGSHINAIIHYHQQNSGEVQITHAGASVTPLAGNSRFNTANGGIVVGIFLFYALFHERGDDDLVAVECRHTGAKLQKFQSFVHESLIQVAVVAHSQVWLGQTGLRHRL